MDDQVKIRGYRIEPGEVESVLLQSGLVRQVVVVAQADSHANKRLVGYYVVAGGGIDQEALPSYLQSRLPEYMIPALWVELETLPLTPNGKIDKRPCPMRVALAC
jgi:acyl-coenzyme A synthetase/AMP-(fatty) acid ligase